jgi:hypothetical protein
MGPLYGAVQEWTQGHTRDSAVRDQEEWISGMSGLARDHDMMLADNIKMRRKLACL